MNDRAGSTLYKGGMMNEIPWSASWRDRQGNMRDLLFYAPVQRGIARIDFKLLLMRMGEPVPERFELEEATMKLPVLQWRQL